MTLLIWVLSQWKTSIASWVRISQHFLPKYPQFQITFLSTCQPDLPKQMFWTNFTNSTELIITSITLSTMVNAWSIQDEIHQQLDHYPASLGTQGKSPLTFKMHTSVMCIRSTATTDIDICAFIARDPTTDHIDSTYAYFCRETYSPPMPEEIQMKRSYQETCIWHHIWLVSHLSWMEIP